MPRAQIYPSRFPHFVCVHPSSPLLLELELVINARHHSLNSCHCFYAVPCEVGNDLKRQHTYFISPPLLYGFINSYSHVAWADLLLHSCKILPVSVLEMRIYSATTSRETASKILPILSVYHIEPNPAPPSRVTKATPPIGPPSPIITPSATAFVVGVVGLDSPEDSHSLFLLISTLPHAEHLYISYHQFFQLTSPSFFF